MSSISFEGEEKVNFNFTLHIIVVYNTQGSFAFGTSSGFL